MVTPTLTAHHIQTSKIATGFRAEDVVVKEEIACSRRRPEPSEALTIDTQKSRSVTPTLSGAP